MSCPFMKMVRKTYGVPAKRGMRVKFKDRSGFITRATSSSRIRVQFIGETHSVILHPTWEITYFRDDGQQLWPKKMEGE